MRMCKEVAAPLFFLGLVFLTLAGCGKPVPAEKRDYVGFWENPIMQLIITQDGSVSYKRLKGGGNIKIEGPLQRFEGDDFVVGIFFINTTFHVERPPYKDGAVWKMVVDGVELVRQGDLKIYKPDMTPKEQTPNAEKTPEAREPIAHEASPAAGATDPATSMADP